jgi:hypothetical protein
MRERMRRRKVALAAAALLLGDLDRLLIHRVFEIILLLLLKT